MERLTNSENESQGQRLSVMTYNLRLDVYLDKENVWANRKDFLCAQVQFYGPDFLGVQEALPNQMQDLKEALKGYKSIGIGRNGEGEAGEHTAIFYNATKFKLEQESTFWLSETPGQKSKGWDATYPRICTYGLFTSLTSGKQFWHFNTHLDHNGEEAQLQGIQLIQKRIAALNTQNLPVVLTGDFNVEPSSKLISELVLSMNDAQELAEQPFGPQGTFNGFEFDKPVTRRIDYIMLSQSNITVEKYAVLSSSFDLKYPSDHFPVFAELKLM